MNRFDDKPLVYLAMRLSDGGRANILGYIGNVGRMIREAVRLWALGYPVFVPCLDILVFIVASALDVEVKMDDVYANSIAIMRRCDVVYIPGPALADGVGAEHNEAQRLHMPVARSRGELSQLVRGLTGKWHWPVAGIEGRKGNRCGF